MRKNKQILTVVGISTFVLVPVFVWLALFIKGKQFALRSRLKKADAIVILAGTRGKMQFLDGKIQTGVKLYKDGWAPAIIASGRFSAKVTDTPALIPLEELELAAKNGRIGEKDIATAAKLWDTALGAMYIRDQAIKQGVPAKAILIENHSLHTRENAEYVLEILKQQNMKRVILITSPFHQLRTYLTFAKVFQPYGIEIINYYADSDEWNPGFWFLNKEHRKLLKGEQERIQKYRAKGDLL